jgi:hypothetical protein
MTVPDLGPWDPLSLTDIVETFAEARFRWWMPRAPDACSVVARHAPQVLALEPVAVAFEADHLGMVD